MVSDAQGGAPAGDFIGVGALVELVGLRARADLNASRGRVARFDEAAGRFVVRVDGPGGSETVRCKPDNLVLAAPRARLRGKTGGGAAEAPAAMNEGEDNVEGPSAPKRARVSSKTSDAAGPCAETRAPQRRAELAGPVYRDEVRDLVELVCDVDMMRSQLEEVGFDCGSSPLEELSRATLREAFTWLNALERELARPQPKEAALQMFTSSFHDTLALSTSGHVIDSLARLEESMALMRSLLDVESVVGKLLRLAQGRGLRKLHDGQDEGDLLPHERSSVGQVVAVEQELELMKRKKPITAFFSWLKDSRARVALELGASASVAEVSRRCGEVWRDLPQEERAPYEESYKSAREAYEAEERGLLERRAAAREAADPLAQRQYRMLSCDMEQVFPESEAGRLIRSMVETTRGLTADPYAISVSRVFALRRGGEDKSFARFSGDPNRTLLWRGARLCSWAGILSQGLRAPPPEAPVAGCPFGKGLYFTDLVGRAVRSCLPGGGSDRQLVVLAEVALGKSLEQPTPIPNLKKLPAGFNSVLGRGATGLDATKAARAPGGALALLGPAAEQPSTPQGGGGFQFNEYCVYNGSQVRMRYLVEVCLSGRAEGPR